MTDTEVINMTDQSKRIVLIPAYCPDKKLLELVRILHKMDFSIVVVNDGSNTERAPLFAAVSGYAAVLTHEKNKGKGAALKTGLEYIKNTFSVPYIVVTADADGQHLPEDILIVCEKAENNIGCLILGSRIIGRDAPLRSRIGNGITRQIFRLSTGTAIYDTQTGLRAFSNGLTDYMLSVEGERYEYEMNVLLHLGQNNINAQEIPIRTVYIDNNSSSHFHPIRDSFKIYREILRFSASSLLSFCIDYGLFCALMALTGLTVLSNVLARTASASINFSLNRSFVFGSRTHILKSAVRYFLLAVIVLAFNTCILKLLIAAGLPYMLAKIITETAMFIFSWTVQRLFVFKEAKT